MTPFSGTYFTFMLPFLEASGCSVIPSVLDKGLSHSHRLAWPEIVLRFAPRRFPI